MPSWTRGKWKSVMKNFKKCEILKIPNHQKKDTDDDNKFTDFVIVHQTYADQSKKAVVTHEDLIKCVHDVLDVEGVVKCPITAIHLGRLHHLPENMKDEFNNPLFQDTELKQQFDAAQFDVVAVNNCLKGLGEHIEFLSAHNIMESLVCVLRIKNSSINTVNSMLSDWVKCIMQARLATNAYVTEVNRRAAIYNIRNTFGDGS